MKPNVIRLLGAESAAQREERKINGAAPATVTVLIKLRRVTEWDDFMTIHLAVQGVLDKHSRIGLCWWDGALSQLQFTIDGRPRIPGEYYRRKLEINIKPRTPAHPRA
jgi:hypothetical protein